LLKTFWRKAIKTPVDRFDFYLPEKNIAQYPSDKRDESRLLIYDRESGEIKDRIFKDILSEITENDFLVINNTKVLKARLLGRKKTGGRIEILVLNIISPTECEAITRGNIKKGDEIFLENSSAKILDADTSGKRHILFSDNIYRIMDTEGHIPLPPYVKREDEEVDEKRYQTVYSSNPGSIAAPTAGLHFTNELIQKIKQKGAEVLEITLNVGIGTFRPIKTEYIEDHQMHEEYFYIPKNTYERINRLKREGKNLIAVGTTTLRALESASQDGQLTKHGELCTNIFITPGYSFKILDKMITNFHLPKSTLFILMCALCGTDEMKSVYQHAVNKNYRFFSYGDAMFIK